MLDLKHPIIPAPKEDVVAVESLPVMQDVPEDEPEFAGATAGPVDELSDIELLLAGVADAVAWDAHHVLEGASLRKHYLLLGALVVAGGLVAYWQSSVSAFVVAVAGAAALEARNRWSRPVQVAIDQHGVRLDGSEYFHADFASFDIHTMPDGKYELSLQSQKWNSPHLRIPLGEQDPEYVGLVVSRYIPRGRHRIPLLEHLIRRS